MNTISDKLSLKTVVLDAWNKFKSNWLLLILGTVLVLLISTAFELISKKVEGVSGKGIVYVLVIIISVIVGIIVKIGYIKFILKAYDKHAPLDLLEIFKAYGLFWNYVWVSIVYFLAILGGGILLIVPGVYIAIRFFFAQLLVIDKGLTLKDSFSQSTVMSQGIKWKLLGYMIVIVAIQFVGALFFGVGLIVTMPFAMLMMASVYRNRLGNGVVSQVIDTVAAPVSEPAVESGAESEVEPVEKVEAETPVSDAPAA